MYVGQVFMSRKNQIELILKGGSLQRYTFKNETGFEPWYCSLHKSFLAKHCLIVSKMSKEK
jgi:hypothetical protein